MYGKVIAKDHEFYSKVMKDYEPVSKAGGLSEGQYKAALKKYNEIMSRLGYEHNTIGEWLSEGTEHWNLRDMVAECDYVLDCYYEDGHCNGDLRYSDDPKEREMWRRETGYLKRFISHYEPYVDELVCAQGHCSRFDNRR